MNDPVKLMPWEDGRKALPAANAPNYDQRLRETVMTYMGKQGNALDRGVTLRDLSAAGIIALRAGFPTHPGGNPIGGPGGAIADADKPDLTPPPNATGLVVTAGISYLLVECDVPTYTQGHGHGRTNVYGVTVNLGDPLPVFTDSVRLTSFVGGVFAYPTNPSTTWRIWIKWETRDGVESPDPTGGINGYEAITGQDVSSLLEALTGKITAGQLNNTLGTRIDLIDGGVLMTGSVAERISTSANALGAQIDALGSTVADITGAAEYDNATTYALDDAVQYLGKLYKAKGATTGNLPTNTTYWEKLGDYASLVGLVSAHGTQITDHETRIASNEGSISTTSSNVSALTSRVTNAETASGVQATAISAIQTHATSQDGVLTAQSTQISGLASTVVANDNAQSAAVQAEATTRASTDGQLLAQYTVKVDVNGYVAGYGLASTPVDGIPQSSFAVRADEFFIASPSGPGINPAMPFIVRTTQTTINGQTVPPGTYLTDVFIGNGTIDSAKIGKLVVDDQHVNFLTVGKLKAGAIAVGEYIQSQGYLPGLNGWRVHSNGSGEFNNMVARGTIYATSGTLGGIQINGSQIFSTNYNYTAGTGFYLGADGQLILPGGSVNARSIAAKAVTADKINVGSLSAITANIGHMTGVAIDVHSANGDASWGYVRSLDKWWGSPGSGFVFGRQGSDGATFMDVSGGNNRIWMSSWNECGIQFPGITMTQGGLTISQANVINTLNVNGGAITVNRYATIGAAQDKGNGVWQSSAFIYNFNSGGSDVIFMLKCTDTFPFMYGVVPVQVLQNGGPIANRFGGSGNFINYTYDGNSTYEIRLSGNITTKDDISWGEIIMLACKR